ncbi:hypothetical protein HGRIS_014379 [Hohenbuehelia grisea]|uniref:Transmembrane protein n=1 Tax=Hohenbuehelia grisea TaxID=104357 RepID=A0ABR3JVE6_9AGAR
MVSGWMRRLFLILVLVCNLEVALAQSTSHAQCDAGFDWMFNSRQQSPCAMAEALGGVCTGGGFTLPPLETDEMYVGPYKSTQTVCRCSSVFYSLASACAACQSESWIKWSAYAYANCSTISVGWFPTNYPPGIPIPHYAFQNVTITDGWDLNIALADHGPESGASPSPRVSPTPTQTSSSHPNVGAIAGGVVGGIIGLGIIVAGTIFFVCRRRRHRDTPPALDLTTGTGSPPAGIDEKINGSITPFTPPQSPVLYNPSDPSTFPTLHTPDSSAHMTYATSPHQSMITPAGTETTLSYAEPISPRIAGYRGVAEV